MTAYTFSQLIDFTRTTSATYVNASGVVTTTPASVNLLLYTQALATSPWESSAQGTAVLPTATNNAGTAPDGTDTATRLQLSLAGGTTTGDIGRRRQMITFTAVQYTFSVWIRSTDGLSNFNIHLQDPAGATQNIAVTGSWTRYTVSGVGPTGTGYVSIGLRGGQTPANSNTADILVWGAQLELGSTASAYTKNVGGFFPPRFDYNPATLAPLGLLVEEQRTNSFTQSEFANGVTDAPTRGGLISATTFSGLIGTTGLAFGHDGTTTSFAYKDGSVNGTTYAISAFVRMDDGNAPVFSSSTLSDATNTFAFVVGGTGINPTTYVVTNFGGGLYRVAATGTSGAATTNSGIVKYNTNNNRTFKVSGYVLEAGTFATSYIRTVASTVTRAGDQAAIAAPMFAPWYNQPAGSLLCDFSPLIATGNGGAVSLNAGSSANRMDIRRDGSSIVSVSGATQASLSIAGMTANVSNRLAFAYAANDFALLRNGGSPSTDSSGTVPLVDLLQIGGLDNNPNLQLSGHLRSINYYPLRLTNAQLQGLTT